MPLVQNDVRMPINDLGNGGDFVLETRDAETRELVQVKISGLLYADYPGHHPQTKRDVWKHALPAILAFASRQYDSPSYKGEIFVASGDIIK